MAGVAPLAAKKRRLGVAARSLSGEGLAINIMLKQASTGNSFFARFNRSVVSTEGG